ncbi:MAG: DHA2 family efflux MFS transporter permease subunit [Candidatus Dormibacteraeota bacterium]|nr:DHA2 family efflux MFS transporter permease subunit [Candidatus Dormibacteraeota bacterium]
MSAVEAPEPVDRLRLPALVVFGLMAGPFLTMVDSSVVNVAVPDIARSLHTDLATVQWTVSAYLLALAAALAASGWLTRRFGSRPVYAASLLGFTAASALCAFAPSINFLVVARALQGLAGAPMTPIAMAMMTGGGSAQNSQRSIHPAAGFLLFLAPAAGPSLGGVLINAFGWPAIFLINVPFGVLGLLGSLRISPRLAMPADPSARFDPIGLGLLAAGTGLALFGAGAAATRGWTSAGTWPFWSSGLLLIAAYLTWAVRNPEPVLNLRLLRRRATAIPVALSALFSVVSFAALFLIPVVMQTIQGFSAIQAGLAMLPQGAVMGLGTVVGGRLIRPDMQRPAAVLGSLTLVATTAAMLLIEVSTPAWVIALILCGRGLAFGMVTTPLLVGVMGSLPQSEVADGSTLFNVAQRLAGSFGIGLLATFFAARAGSRVGDALSRLGVSLQTSGGGPGGSLTGGLAQAPPAIRAAVDAALASAFHDVVWALVALAAGGVVLGLLLPGRGAPQPRPAAGLSLRPQGGGQGETD